MRCETLFFALRGFCACPQWLIRAFEASGIDVESLALPIVEPAVSPFGMVVWVVIIPMLLTLVLLFAFQGEQIIAQPVVILLLVVPILIQVVVNASLAYLASHQLGVGHDPPHCPEPYFDRGRPPAIIAQCSINCY
jgi:hypothetical protein